MVLAKPYTGSLGKAGSGVKPTMGEGKEAVSETRVEMVNIRKSC
jgi:hypothetical protein